jgi:rubrerythrin
MSPRTKLNLNSTMQSEAFNHAMYLRFAARARMNGNRQLALLFQNAADSDRIEHFAKEADLAGLVANDSENLRYAMEEGRVEAAMYGKFAKEAATDGDFIAAALFESIQTAKATQTETFEAALRTHASERTAGLVEV